MPSGRLYPVILQEEGFSIWSIGEPVSNVTFVIVDSGISENMIILAEHAVEPVVAYKITIC